MFISHGYLFPSLISFRSYLSSFCLIFVPLTVFIISNFIVLLTYLMIMIVLILELRLCSLLRHRNFDIGEEDCVLRCVSLILIRNALRLQFLGVESFENEL